MVSSISSMKLPTVAINKAPKVKGGKGKKASLNQDDDDDDDPTSFAAVMGKMAPPTSSLTTEAQTADAATQPSASDRIAARDMVRRQNG